MNRNPRFVSVFLLMFFVVSFFTGCASTVPDSVPDTRQPRVSLHDFLLPEASGTVTYDNSLASIDASHTDEGYVMIRYVGTSAKAKVQVTTPTEITYTYTLLGDSYETFPLSGGSGDYHIDIYENAYDDLYALVFSQDVSVALSNEFTPFLYPNQYSWYTRDCETVQLGIRLSDQSFGDLDYVCRVYDYIIHNITYDTELAASTPVDYVPDNDRTLENGTGICFDYAALMTAMLRSQGIPTKLEVGYSGTAYHAWISVYLKESGWVDGIISFDGKSWSLMDPTLAAGNSSKAVGQYIGDGTNYTVKYSY